MILQFQFWVHNQRKQKSISQRGIRIPMFIAGLFKIAKYGNNQGIHQMMNG